MFRNSRRPTAPDEIYASSLQTLNQGHALWFPEPHGSGQPQIGDVGFILEGAFVRLFNLDTSAPDKKVTYWEPRPPFKITEPLPEGVLKTDARPRVLLPGDYCSHGVQRKDIHAAVDVTASVDISVGLSASYTCKEERGAVLALKSDAHAETIYKNQIFKKYIFRNIRAWHAYAKDVLGLDIKQEDLVVVSGWVKTTADWAETAFSNTSTRSSGSLEGHVGGVARVEVGGSYTSSVMGPKMHRHAEHYSSKTFGSHSAEFRRDQCIFLKYYKVLRRLLLPPKLVAGAGYHRLPDLGDGRGASKGEGVALEELEDLD
ncbi:uncharacterized protein PHACADRAFT_248999, partial [Phanerochaete carnosa HHB-10118-sp]